MSISILQYEVKWALESIITNKASGGDEIPVELFPERWCCESAALNMPANLENSAVATGLENVSFHSNSKERQCKRMLKLPHNCTHHAYLPFSYLFQFISTYSLAIVHFGFPVFSRKVNIWLKYFLPILFLKSCYSCNSNRFSPFTLLFICCYYL